MNSVLLSFTNINIKKNFVSCDLDYFLFLMDVSNFLDHIFIICYLLNIHVFLMSINFGALFIKRRCVVLLSDIKKIYMIQNFTFGKVMIVIYC